MLRPRISCFQAVPAVPTTAESGTRTSSKNTSLTVCASIVGIARIVRPGVGVGTISRVSPACLPRVESSRVSTSRCSATWAAEIHVFWPLMT